MKYFHNEFFILMLNSYDCMTRQLTESLDFRKAKQKKKIQSLTSAIFLPVIWSYELRL